jgi:anti-sigma B factor antagonist
MDDTTFLHCEAAGRGVVARVRFEKVGGREAPILQEELLAAAGGFGWRLAIDLSEVTLLSSMGLGALVTLQKKCREEKGALVVFGLRKEVAEVLALTHLDRVIKIVPDLAAAKKLLV